LERDEIETRTLVQERDLHSEWTGATFNDSIPFASIIVYGLTGVCELISIAHLSIQPFLSKPAPQKQKDIINASIMPKYPPKESE
jgi:hypothetical protein